MLSVSGVMSYVGDAIAEQPIAVRNGLAVIGFVSWGILHGRDKLVFRKKQKPKFGNLALGLYFVCNYKTGKRQLITATRVFVSFLTRTR